MCHRHDPVPGSQVRDTRPKSVYDAGDVVAEYARYAQAGPAAVGPVPGIDRVEARGHDPDPDLSVGWHRIGYLGWPELLWPAELADDNRPHDVLPRYAVLIQVPARADHNSWRLASYGHDE
jgi:uncharacterized protein YbjT (DUF2867 family)